MSQSNPVPDASGTPASPRWPGTCYRCKRERDIETRHSHASQTLCDVCADKPHRRPTADLEHTEPVAKLPVHGDPTPLTVQVDAKGKLILPPIPDDGPGQCAWLTAVFNLDPACPITRGEWQGPRGPDGHLILIRAGAPDLRFEPARTINSPMKLIETFTGRRHKGDGLLHALKAEHCRKIAYVSEMLCDTSAALTEAEEALGIVGTFLQTATAAEGFTTYGTAGQRYEAARALRRDVDDYNGRPTGGPRYLVDALSGERVDDATGEILDEGKPPEIVIAVSELSEAARRHVGSSLPRGWLDARMDGLGWRRITVDGHMTAGRAGRKGPHATVHAYRGSLPVTT